MKATEAKLLDFLKKSTQFVIPIYQRTYSWTKSECEQLWMDILKNRKRKKYLCSLYWFYLFILKKSLYQVSNQSPLLVIDGQQRLTTISLIIEALARNIGNTETFRRIFGKKATRILST